MAQVKHLQIEFRLNLFCQRKLISTSFVSLNWLSMQSLLCERFPHFLNLFHIYLWTVSESGPFLLCKNSPNDTSCSRYRYSSVEEAEQVLHLYRSTRFSAEYCRLHAAHRRDWNNPLSPLWVVLDFCNVPERKDRGHLSELGFSASKWWGTALLAH